MARLGPCLPSRAVAVKASGTTTDSPPPSSANPARLDQTWPTSSAAPNPAAAIPADSRISRTGPRRSASQSPLSRPAVMVTANAVNPTAASAGDAPSDECR